MKNKLTTFGSSIRLIGLMNSPSNANKAKIVVIIPLMIFIMRKISKMSMESTLLIKERKKRRMKRKKVRKLKNKRNKSELRLINRGSH